MKNASLAGRAGWLAYAALLVAGCANIDTVSPEKAELDPSQGYALVSLSHSGYGWLENLVVTYRRNGSVDNRQIAIAPRKLFREPESGVLLRDTEKRMIGELKLLSLPQGDYEFVNWRVLASTGNVGLMLVSTTWHPVDPPPPLAFKVVAGRITYIGNLDILIPAQKRYRWRALDERTRDLQLFESRFAGSRRLATEVRLMERRDPSAAEFEGATNN